MILTEKEARKKWCPFGRASEYDDGGDHPDFQHTLTGNRGGRYLHTTCIASECMAWREAEAKWAGQGFCGLAGKP